MSNKRYYHPIEFTEIGQLVKPFGLNGQLRYLLQIESLVDLSIAEYLWVLCFGCYVPHKIQAVELDQQLIQLMEIDNVDIAKEYGQRMIALPTAQLHDLQEETDESVLWLVGHLFSDKTSGKEGQIVKQEEMGPQIMLTVQVDKQKYWIPLVDEWINNYSPDDKHIQMMLPENMFSNPIDG